MDPRKSLILNTIIKEHIATGQPVSSGVLVEKYKLDISPATVRNEMAALEEENLIIQPHTSAGRVPTEHAYKLYIGGLDARKLGRAEMAELEKILQPISDENLKGVAKHLSSLTGVAVFWAFHRHNLYYTGISNLFQQPEFCRLTVIQDISAIIDRIDEIINEIFNDIEDGVSVKIGSDCPFGDFSSTIMAKYRIGEHDALFGILGPMRMDYEKNIALIEYINNFLQDNR